MPQPLSTSDPIFSANVRELIRKYHDILVVTRYAASAGGFFGSLRAVMPQHVETATTPSATLATATSMLDKTVQNMFVPVLQYVSEALAAADRGKM